MRSAALVVCLLALVLGCAAREAPHGVAVSENSSERKIIYHGQLQLVVSDLSRFETELTAHLQQVGGFVADYSQERLIDNRSHAQWTVRIPADDFQTSVKAIAALGLATRRELSSEDVTDATLDLEARLKNQRTLEARLLAIVDQQAGELKDVLAVETELSRVRQEIERLEGQQRAMQDRVALSTLVISVSEQPDYLPAATASFSDRVRIACNGSLQIVLEGGEFVLISMIFCLPWLLMVTLLLSAFYWIVKRRLAIEKLTSAARAN